ncbi:unannotated protein [freshwater metagenome]|uniref:Unannotated protein n=1 Tax=freshwater metagenome TaxID=449393 RepID=A0A6J6DZ45_9ZZZZ
MTLTYIYAESTAVVGPLATYSEPHAYDLCVLHGTRLKVPNGWSVIKAEITNEVVGPSDDDLMVIADAVREVASHTVESDSGSGAVPNGQQIGRRGHLRSVPN